MRIICRLILVLLGLSLCGCGPYEDNGFESKWTESTRSNARETITPSKGFKMDNSFTSTYNNEYDTGKVYPPGTTQFQGGMDENGRTKGTSYYENGKQVQGNVSYGRRLWYVEPEN